MSSAQLLVSKGSANLHTPYYSLPGSSLVMPIREALPPFISSVFEAEPLDMGSQAGAWEPVKRTKVLTTNDYFRRSPNLR